MVSLKMVRTNAESFTVTIIFCSELDLLFHCMALTIVTIANSYRRLTTDGQQVWIADVRILKVVARTQRFGNGIHSLNMENEPCPHYYAYAINFN